MAEETEDEDEGGGGAGLEEEQACPEGAPEWVVTFGDMMSLLLTFFILLLSFATMDVLRFKELAGTIKQGFGIKVKEQFVIIQKAEDIIQKEPRVDYNAKRIMQELKRKMEPESPQRRNAKVNVEVFETYRGVTVMFPVTEVFVEGTDRLRPQAKPLLDYVAEQADAEQQFELSVEVHGDPEGARAPQFEDVWALTAAQSVSLARYLRLSGGLEGPQVVPVGRGPAPATERPGRPSNIEGSTVEFVFLSKTLRPQE
jgi:chemotaxis protein MotB